MDVRLASIYGVVDPGELNPDAPFDFGEGKLLVAGNKVDVVSQVFPVATGVTFQPRVPVRLDGQGRAVAATAASRNDCPAIGLVLNTEAGSQVRVQLH